MKKTISSLAHGLLALCAALALVSCAPLKEQQNAGKPLPPSTAEPPPMQEPAALQLPVRFQNPEYAIKPLSGKEFGSKENVTFPVGADITSAAPVPLRDIIKQLAQIKGMNISWASDVDQSATVDVEIRAEDDFYTAIDNLLRQVDYFHEIRGNTLVIKYKDVRKFHIAMPFVASTYSSGLGGDVLGGGDKGGNMQGKVQLNSDGNEFDIWKNIKENLDKVLEIWEAPAPAATPATPPPAAGEKKAAAAPEPPPAPSRPPVGKGYYTIDKPIGLITVTAPRSLLDQIAQYISNLKSELYRQVIIEAKIVEVTLNSDNTTGINWEDLLQNPNNLFGFNLDFQKLSPSYPNYGSFLTIDNHSFGLFLDAIKTQGTTDVIANPKVSVMNGQPAMINIGENVTYIDSVETTRDAETRSITFTVKTQNIMSGIVLSVVPTILDDNQIILTLAPVTSQLQEPIEYRTFGEGQVGLPRINVREMSTMVRLKDNEMLVVGGLIDNTEAEDSSKIPGLGDIPGIRKLFGIDGKVVKRKELVIFRKPRIVS